MPTPTFQFGDSVMFTHHYRRFVGRSQVWPRGDRARYGDPVGYSLGLPERHPDSTLEMEALVREGYFGRGEHMLPVSWQRLPNTHPTPSPIVGIFGGECRKAEGWAGKTWEEYVGHDWKLHGYVHLAEVMVRGVGRPLMRVVHLDDLAASS